MSFIIYQDNKKIVGIIGCFSNLNSCLFGFADNEGVNNDFEKHIMY